MSEQLKLDLSQVKSIVINDENDEEEDSEEALVYKKRLKKLINKIAEMERYEGIQCTKEGTKRLQETSKLVLE